MIKKILNTLLTGAVILSFTSCEKKEYESFEELDNRNITEYISKNNLQVTKYKNTDLFYQVLEEGTGRDIKYSETYPITFTVKSLDGSYVSADTFKSSNRYIDYFGYFPFSSNSAGGINSPVEKTEDLKEVIKNVLGKTNGKIRIIVPSRLTAYGRNGNRQLGIPPNASMDYTISVHDNVEDYEESVIKQRIVSAGFELGEFTRSEDGIYYKIITPGTGNVISADSTVTANYTLWNTGGEKIDSGENYRATLNYGTIESWGKMIPLIRRGGKIRFITPSAYGYGTSGSGGIGPFSPLDFEVNVQ